MRTIAMSNVIGASIAREAGTVVYTLAGPEIAVASTKAYLAQVLLFELIALDLAHLRGRLTDAQLKEALAELGRLPEQAAAILARREVVESFARRNRACHDVFFIGRLMDYTTSLEAALKLKEVSYPVSYTHLDVYKRQPASGAPRRRLRQALPARAAGQTWRAVAATPFRRLQSARPPCALTFLSVAQCALRSNAGEVVRGLVGGAVARVLVGVKFLLLAGKVSVQQLLRQRAAQKLALPRSAQRLPQRGRQPRRRAAGKQIAVRGLGQRQPGQHALKARA